MDEKTKFQASFLMTEKLYRTMVYGIFLYPLFVAGVETFHWGIFHFLNFETMKKMGLVFMVLTLISFPLTHITYKFFTRGISDIAPLGQRLVYIEILNMGISELISVYGLVIYITSANLKFFYLFFVISFIHLLSIRPSRKRWQNHLDKISVH